MMTAVREVGLWMPDPERGFVQWGRLRAAALWASSLAVLSVPLSLLRGFGSDGVSVVEALAITVVMAAGLWLLGTGVMLLILGACQVFCVNDLVVVVDFR